MSARNRQDNKIPRTCPESPLSLPGNESCANQKEVKISLFAGPGAAKQTTKRQVYGVNERTKESISTIKIKLDEKNAMGYVVARIQMISQKWPVTIAHSDQKRRCKDRIEAKKDGRWNWRNKPSPFAAGEGEGGWTWRREDEQGTAASSGSSSRGERTKAPVIATKPNKLNCQRIQHSAILNTSVAGTLIEIAQNTQYFLSQLSCNTKSIST